MDVSPAETSNDRERLPPGYAGVAISKRPINDTPLAAVLKEKGLSYWKAEMITGIAAAKLGVFARNQALPGYMAAMRMQVHLGVPIESWVGTVLGKLMWDLSKPDPEALKAKRQQYWRNWAEKNGHYEKRYARRKRLEVSDAEDSEWLNGNLPEQSVPLNKEATEEFLGVDK